MPAVLSAFAAGVLFALGLVSSEMVNPRRVQGFLDVTGNWDLSLAIVMATALLTTAIGYRLVFARGKPLLAHTFSVPARGEITVSLLVGATLFGIGWGLSGFCPGPALVASATLDTNVLVFIAAMIVGMKIFDLQRHLKTGSEPEMVTTEQLRE